MSREIDERIVAMYFDNQNFERNAQKTIQTLDELKESANMKGIEKGLDMFGQIGEKLNLDKINQSATKLKNTISGFGSLFKKAFSLGPIDELYHALDNFKNKYFDRVLGFDIAQKLVSNIERTLRSLTIEPISAGYSQYETTMDSIKTIMNSTGEDLEAVKLQLADLTKYANQTIYSLTDMTSNIGKFTNNGVKLNDAKDAMIGLANATAAAGQGAQQASMAMYNVSQAIGVGKMTTIDWKSLENANIATRELKQTFIEAAAAAGQLEKKTVGGVDRYYVKLDEEQKKSTKKVEQTEVTFENFRETLNKGWLTKDAMMNTFAIYSNQLSIEEIAALGFSQKEAVRLKQIGEEAEKAATEVRTFHKMMDALKEGVQSSWATSFEYVFGDMEEGTSLWTTLNKKIEDILNESADKRNKMLIAWRGMMEDENGQLRRIEDVYKARKEMLDRELATGTITQTEYEERLRELEEAIGDPALWVDYRTVLIDTFMDLFDVVKGISGTISGAFEEIFGSFGVDSLKRITQGFRDFVDQVKDWLGTTKDADSRISKIRNTFIGLFSVIKTGYIVFKTAVQIAWRVIKPFIDPVLDLLSRIGNFLNLGQAKTLADVIGTLSKRFGDWFKNLKALGWSGVLTKVGDWFKDIWANIKSGISQWLADNGLQGVADWFVSFGDTIKGAFNTVKTKLDELGITKFFTDLWNGIVGLFTPKKTVRYNGSMKETIIEDSPIVAFFKNLRTSVGNAFEEVKKWWEGSGIPQFFTRMWNGIIGLFEPKKQYDDRGFELYERADSPIVAFFKNLWTSIDAAFQEVRTWWQRSGIPQFFTRMWNSIVGLFEPKKHYDDRGFELYERADSPIVAFFKNLWTSIDAAFQEVKTWWENSGIPQFFTRMWNEIIGLFEPKKQYDDRGFELYEKADSPIVAFFKNLWTSIDAAFQEVRTWWERSGIPQFFTRMWNGIVGLFEPKKQYDDRGFELYEKVDSPIVAFFKNLWTSIDAAFQEVKAWWERSGIPQFFARMWNKIVGLFEPKKQYDDRGFELYEKADSPIVAFFKGVFNGIVETWNKIVGWEGWAAVGSFFADTWNWLIGLIKGEDSSTGGSKVSETVSAAKGIAEKMTDVTDVVDDLKTNGKKVVEGETWLDKISSFITSIFSSVGDTIASIGSVTHATEILDDISKIFDILMAIITTIVNTLHRIIFNDYGDDEQAQKIADWTGLIFSVIGIIVAKWAEAKKLSKLATISEAMGGSNNIGMQILEIAGAIAIIAFAIEKLGSISLGQLVQGESAVLVVGVIIGILIALIGKIRAVSSVTNKEPEKAWERVLGKLVSWVGMAGMLWILVENIPSILGALAEAKKSGGLTGDDVLKTFESILMTIGGAMLVLAVVSKIMPKGIDPVATIKTLVSVLSAILITGAAILASGGLLSLIGDTEDIKGAMEKAAAFLEGLGDAVNALFRGLTGQTHAEKLQEDTAKKNLEHTNSILGFLSEYTDNFSADNLSSLTLAMQTITSMTDMAKGVDTSTLLGFSKTMDELTTGLLKFSELFSGKYIMQLNGNGIYETKYLEGFVERGTKNWDNLMAAIDLVKQFFEALGPGAIFTQSTPAYVRTWFENLSNSEYINMIITGMNNIIDSAGGLHDASGIQFDGFAIVKRFYESIADVWNSSDENPDLPKFNAQPIVNAILDSLLVGEYSIKEGVKAMVQAGIDLLNTSNKSDGNSFDFSGLMGGLNFDWSSYFTLPDTTEIIEEVGKATGTLDSEITNKVSGTVDKVSGIKLKISGIDISTDEDKNGIPDFLDSIQSNVDDLQAVLDSDENYQISIRPVFDLSNMDTEMGKLREYFTGQVPLSINSSVSLGETKLPIDDTGIVGKLDELIAEVKSYGSAVNTSVGNAASSIGTDIRGLGDDIARMKVWIESKALVGAIVDDMDEALYEKGYMASMTGVG